MKIAPFRYACPSSLEDAIGMLADSDGEAKVLGGGQSLMPLLAFRLAAPKLLVDLRHVTGLDGIRVDRTHVELGGRVRWRDIETSRALADAHPLLVAAVRHVAHYQIRNRGTVGGSLAHADPAAELPAVAVTCGATIVAQGKDGERRIAAEDFFLGPLTTALQSDEIVTALRLPLCPKHQRHGFEEFSRRRGDFALAGVAVLYDLHSDRMRNVRVGGFGIADTPLRIVAAEAALEGGIPNRAIFDAASAAAELAIAPASDAQADADYRRALFGTLLRTALEKSMQGGPV